MATQAQLFSFSADTTGIGGDGRWCYRLDPRRQRRRYARRGSYHRSRCGPGQEDRLHQGPAVHDGQHAKGLDLADRGGRRQGSASSVEAPGRFGGVEGDRPVRWRDPAVPLQHLPSFRDRDSSPADHRPRNGRASAPAVRRRPEAIGRRVHHCLPKPVPGCGKAAPRSVQSRRLPAGRRCRRREFGFSWQYVSFGVPDQLKGISREVWEQEREKAAQRMAEASAEIQQVFGSRWRSLSSTWPTGLKEGADGKPLRFKETTVSNLVEFLTNFEFRNVTDDAELQTLGCAGAATPAGRQCGRLAGNRRPSREGSAGHGGHRRSARHDADENRRPEVPLRRGGGMTPGFVAAVLEGFEGTLEAVLERLDEGI